MTSAVTGTNSTATSTTTSKAAQAGTKLAENMDMFLTMLTTQLKNQDPLSPMDSTQFTQQLVQFASVEQQISANSNLEKLISLQKSNQVSEALSYIGKTVKAESSQIALQDKEADFTYLLPEDAASVTITIKDASGVTVKQVALGQTSAGEHDGVWDGKDGSGNQLPDGAYQLSIAATSKDGTVSKASTSMIAKVTAVATNDGTTTLSANGVEVPFGKIISISEPITKTSTTTEV